MITAINGSAILGAKPFEKAKTVLSDTDQGRVSQAITSNLTEQSCAQ